ncbi:MAG: class I SAM-dependent methyltransferase [Oscillospiraceae bacterium]|nr:class I SAM-dependent methyltransferase [Oscillospiraceae bacterium]
MWISDLWQDYALLDCADGERLERWGGVTLIRPDPAVLWSDRNADWSRFDARYERSGTGGGHWDVRKKNLTKAWEIGFEGLEFYVSLMNFKHTGIFPEQAVNWNWLKTVCAPGTSVLNLFAYTGAATLACASVGASVCHVDAAKGMVERARRNAELSNLADKPIRWIVDDCREFVSREIRRGRRYDAIIMDPPAYGRGAKGEIWKLEDDIFSFCKLCADALSDNPAFVLINSYTTGLSPTVLTYLAESVFSKRFGGTAESRELGLKVQSTGLALPAGASCRWTTAV